MTVLTEWYYSQPASFMDAHLGGLYLNKLSFVTWPVWLLFCFCLRCDRGIEHGFVVHSVTSIACNGVCIKIHIFPLAGIYSTLSQFLWGCVIPFIINSFNVLLRCNFALQKIMQLTSHPCHPKTLAPFIKPLKSLHFSVQCLVVFSAGNWKNSDIW